MNTNEKLSKVSHNMRSAVLGCDEQVGLLLTALLAGGHVLIQGAPGMGKTSLAKTMAASINSKFKRIQFTPDLLPADILGYSIYDQSNGQFKFHEGAVFSNILLADEINRTTPRIQSALLEAMNEAQVSIDGETRQLEAPFFVIATQNHLYSSGTFPLPDSQLDRFLISFEMDRPSANIQMEILKLHHAGGEPSDNINSIASTEDIVAMQNEVRQVSVTEDLLHYISTIAEKTHKEPAFSEGISPRGCLALMRAAQASAWLDERTTVYPDDIKDMIPHVFSHRLSLKHRFRKSGDTIDGKLQDILASVAVP